MNRENCLLLLRECLQVLWRLDKEQVFIPDSLTVMLEEFVRRADVVQAMKEFGLPHFEGEPCPDKRQEDIASFVQGLTDEDE